jgi:hypothetical protein
MSSVDNPTLRIAYSHTPMLVNITAKAIHATHEDSRGTSRS